MATKDEPRHGKRQSISLDIPANGAMFIKLVKEYEDDEQVLIDEDDEEENIKKKKPLKKAKTEKTTRFSLFLLSLFSAFSRMLFSGKISPLPLSG